MKKELTLEQIKAQYEWAKACVAEYHEAGEKAPQTIYDKMTSLMEQAIALQERR